MVWDQATTIMTTMIIITGRIPRTAITAIIRTRIIPAVIAADVCAWLS